ncbi:RNA-directed DNA polymerase, eukaryota [Tanacetum coccineum]
MHFLPWLETIPSALMERIVWIDIEGVPLHAWSRPTFSKIGSRWGEVIELEDNKEDCFARKRICIKTKLEDNILEKFKIIVRGKNFVIRAKELFVWSPTFNDNKEVDDYSEDDSVNGAEEINGDISKQMNLDDESDIEGVSDTVFDDKADSLGHEHTQNLSPNEKENSSDPFNLYNLLNKRDKGEANSGLDSSIPFPPGFTPEREFQHVDAQEVQGMENSLSKRRSEGLSSRVLEDAQPLNEHVSPSIDSKKKQVARYWRSSRWFPMNCLSLNVQGLGSKAKKDWIKELNNKHKVNFLSVQETKLDCISDMDVKVLWGNYKFEYTISEAVGNSGGILCVWDPSVFRKEHHVVSDNFVALYGSWVSNQAKLLVVSIYAPQSITSKRSLWSYISSLISRWDGHCMVMGDFNEVRCMEDRLGSVYNAHLSDHRPILLQEVVTDYGSSPFRVYHSWFSLQDFDQMVSETWNNIDLDDNKKMVRFKKKLQILKKEIRSWVNDCKKNQSGRLVDLRSKLCHIDKVIDQGGINDDILLTLVTICKRLRFSGLLRAMKTQIFFMESLIINERIWLLKLDMLESPISRDEVRNAVWGCEENKSPGLDGFTFEFFLKFWDTLGSDFCAVVEWFFDHSSFSRGCNSSFIALILKNHDPKFVNDYRPISLIGSLYKVVTKILATRLSSIISGLISDVQTAFLPNMEILRSPLMHKKQQAMVFKVDFAKAYDSIRWDFLEDVLRAFGFGSKWCSWIRGCLHSGMASVLLNGSPTSEFQFHCGLKQGDPLAPYLFILIMESLHLSLSRAIEAGIFKGIKIGSSLNISHLFYADDAVFIGEWSIANLSGITHILHCFSLLFGLSINLKKSHLLGVGIRSEDVNAAALYFGCSTMKTPFKYLGVMVGGNSSTFQAWDDTIGKLKARLSNWKLKTLSVGGRLTLLKSVLGSTPIYNMSIYKVPKSVLQTMESIRRNFFNGVQCDERKIVWIKWAKVLVSKKYGGLGVSSFYALNRALLFKWVWRFISRDNSLWCRLIMSMHGSLLYKLSPFRYSTWKSIIREIGDTQLRVMFPRIYALEINKDCTVADKLQFLVTSSLRRSVRGGVESSQLALLQTYIEGTLLSNMEDRWVKIPRTCSSVADWLRISSDSYAAGGIYHGRPLVHMLIGLIGSIPSD